MAKRKRNNSSKTKDLPLSFQVKPTNQPEVIDYFMTSSDGKNWIKQTGNIKVMITGVKTEDLGVEITSLIEPLSILSQEKQNMQLFEKTIECKHKIHAVRYHLHTLEKEIRERVKIFEKNYNAGAGIAQELENPRLIYETEAFLFQTKSCLDILTQTLGCSIPPLSSMHTFSSKNIDGVKQAGGKVINALIHSSFKELGNLLEYHRVNWIQDLVDMRDSITHYTHLRGFHCFIEEPYMGGRQVTIHYPTMPSGIRVDTYCQSIYEKLLDLYRSAFAFIKLE